MTEALATQKLSAVESLVEQLADAEQKLEAGYAHLGLLLDDVMKQRYWEGTYESFGSFMAHLSEKYNVGRAQLYNYRHTVTKLLEAGIEPEEMNKMGINKARALARVENPPANVIEAALKPTVTAKQVENMLDEALHRPQREDTEWHNLQFKFYLTDEEYATLSDAANAARHGDPAIPNDVSETEQNKQIVLKWAQEYLASHSEDVVEGGHGL